jgi:fructuronate reductase
VMNDAADTLRLPPGTDVDAYERSLLDRFRNPALRHRTWQIAMDGTQKLPQRLLGTVRDRLAAGASIERLALGVAAWMRYATGQDERGGTIDLRDPLADELRRRTAGIGDAAALAKTLISLEAVFGQDLTAEPRFTRAVTDALSRLMRDGAAATVARFGE